MLEVTKKLLFVAPACFGHINQMIVLAREIRALGHRVGFACAEQYQDRIRDAGIEFLRWEPEDSMTDSSVVERRASLWSDVSKSHSFLWSELRMLSSARETYGAMYTSLLPIWKHFSP